MSIGFHLARTENVPTIQNTTRTQQLFAMEQNENNHTTITHVRYIHNGNRSPCIVIVSTAYLSCEKIASLSYIYTPWKTSHVLKTSYSNMYIFSSLYVSVRSVNAWKRQEEGEQEEEAGRMEAAGFRHTILDTARVLPSVPSKKCKTSHPGNISFSSQEPRRNAGFLGRPPR